MPEVGDIVEELVCWYSAAHFAKGEAAVGVIDCGPVGSVPACQKCINFYDSMGEE